MILESASLHAHESACLPAQEGFEPVHAADVATLIQALRLTPPEVVVVG